MKAPNPSPRLRSVQSWHKFIKSVADSSEVKEDPVANDQLMTIKEVADFLRISTISAYSWVRDGKLPAIRIGKEWRVRSRDLDEWLEVRSTARHRLD